MKLINCYISSFGKIKDFNFDFSDGINTILQENGWGKTTFSIFLKAMFYGLDDSKRNVLENERTKYKPWGSKEFFGGTLTFTYADKPFKIERYFGDKSSEDYAKLIDLTTGKTTEFNNDKEELGKRIFKIDKEGFLSTTFFSEKDFEIKSNSSVTAKFNSTFEEQDTDLYDLAICKLDKKIKEYKQRGDKGLIPETKRHLFELRDKINAESELSQAVEQIKKDVLETELEIASLKESEITYSQEYEKAVSKENLALKKSNYDKLLSEKGKFNSILQNSNDILNGKNLSNQEIGAVKKTIDDFVKSKAQLEVVSNEYDSLLLKDKEKQQNQPKKPYFISIILAIIGVALFFVNIIAGVSVVVVALASFIIMRLSKVDRRNDSFNEYLINYQNNLAEYKNIVNQYDSALMGFFQGFKVDVEKGYAFAIEIISQALSEKNIATTKLLELDFEIEALEKEGIQDVRIDNYVDGSSFKNQLASLREKISLKSDYLSKRKLILRQYEERLLQVTDYESEVSELSELLEEYNKSYDVFSLTMQYLTQADENLRIQYRKPLYDSFNKYLRLLTGKELKADIDVDFKITVEEKYGNKEYDYYSQGCKNVLEICKRLALIDLLFDQEKPFIVLDDPFINMDENNLAGALDLLTGLSSEYQIIYLICHNSRSVEIEAKF